MDIPTMSKRSVEGLGEVIFDITTCTNCHLNNLEDWERDALMDEIEGSRGLYWNHILPWAREWQNSWEAMEPDERNAAGENYIVDIDAYGRKKFVELRALLDKPVSVQVVPVIHYPRSEAQNEHAEPQFDGPTADTTCWGVYERDCAGQVTWVADFGLQREADAMLFAQALAAKHGVPLEPQPWKVPKQAAPTERYHVSWRIDLDASGPRAAALEALRIQRDPLSIATVFDVRPDDSDRAIRVDLSEK